MAGSTININDSGFTGYLSVPKTANGAGILLIQEIFGVNSHIKDVADLYADAGYTVLAPDVFWRVQRDVQLGYSPDDIQKGMKFAQKLDMKQTIGDLKDAIKKLKSVPECKGKVGTVGYCMGGTYAYELAVNGAVDIAISYYGGGVAQHLDEAKNLSCPIMLHFGSKDKHITKGDVQNIREALSNKADVELYVYDADHGFNCDQRPSYDRRSAMLAFGRTMILLSKVTA